MALKERKDYRHANIYDFIQLDAKEKQRIIQKNEKQKLNYTQKNILTDGVTQDERSHNIRLINKFEEEGENEVFDDNKSNILDWKYKDYKFPSPLPSKNNNSIAVFSTNKKRIEESDISIDEVLKIFGKKSTANSHIQKLTDGNPFMNESLNDDSGLMCK